MCRIFLELIIYFWCISYKMVHHITGYCTMPSEYINTSEYRMNITKPTIQTTKLFLPPALDVWNFTNVDCLFIVKVLVISADTKTRSYGWLKKLTEDNINCRPPSNCFCLSEERKIIFQSSTSGHQRANSSRNALYARKVHSKTKSRLSPLDHRSIMLGEIFKNKWKKWQNWWLNRTTRH